MQSVREHTAKAQLKRCSCCKVSRGENDLFSATRAEKYYPIESTTTVPTHLAYRTNTSGCRKDLKLDIYSKHDHDSLPSLSRALSTNIMHDVNKQQM